jgi:hypothetical protein
MRDPLTVIFLLLRFTHTLYVAVILAGLDRAIFVVFSLLFHRK